MGKLEPLKQITNIKTGVSSVIRKKKKFVKITILMEQPLLPETEDILRKCLGDSHSLGRYSNFKQENITIEEIDV